MKKRILAILFVFVLSCLIVFGLPLVIKDNTFIETNNNNEVSLVEQEIISYSTNEQTIQKLYSGGKLIGVVTDMNYLNTLIANKYEDYENDFPDSYLGLSDDVYIIKEKTFANYDSADDQIFEYLANNDLLGIQTNAIEFSTDDGVYEIIYVKNIDDFYDARDQFLLNFVSEETLTKLRNNERIDSPSEIGTVEMNLSVLENMTLKEAIAPPNKIFSTFSEIYSFLCYGRNTDREYYTVKEGDTLQGVGYYFGDMSPRQLMMLNTDVLKSENQVLTPGMKLNVTYFTSPISVVVTKQRLSQTYVVPDEPEYIEDDTLDDGVINVVEEEEIGIENVTFEETWINGVRTNGKQLPNKKLIKPSKQGKIIVGAKSSRYIGTGNLIWPIANPEITTDYGGYYGHTGTDFVNRYEKYCDIYAVDNGVVDETGYKYDMGYYLILNHQNGLRTYYMHLNVPSYVEEGDYVNRGDVIGQEGNTGRSEGVHLHFTFELDGERVNACNYMPCSLIR